MLKSPPHFNPRTRVGCDPAHLPASRLRRISIHAPAWGATCNSVLLASADARFQSTHPRGVRQCGWRDFCGWSSISIHAPAWGATCDQPRNAKSRAFQSTHPHGVRPAKGKTGAFNPDNFNPRTRMGCDIDAHSAVMSVFRFQSTHPHGVRQETNALVRASAYISIHAPAWGATPDNQIMLF